jgi:hypothetical protein
MVAISFYCKERAQDCRQKSRLFDGCLHRHPRVPSITRHFGGRPVLIGAAGFSLVQQAIKCLHNFMRILDVSGSKAYMRSHRHPYGNNPMSQDDQEFAAMQTVYKALEPLPPDARQRVMAYINSRLEIAAEPAIAPVHSAADPDDAVQVASIERQQAGAKKYATFAELYDAAQPSSQGDKALVAGYWMQVCQADDSFDSQSVNTELKHLGHGVGNITQAIDGLKTQKPSLVLQLKKSGSSQQARKTYKVTVAGINAVEAMIRG